MNLCKKNNIENFIFSSTAAVYGLGEGESVSETTMTAPINPYGRSKLMTEWMLKDLAFSIPNDFQYIALRYFNVAGADFEKQLGQRTPNATHLIKVALETALGKREQLQVFGSDYETHDGTCIRDYIHVMDLAMAHIDALKYLIENKNNKQSHILNCGYGNGFSVKEVIDVVKKISGVNFKVQEVDRRAGDPPSLISIPNKIKSILGWEPKYNDLEKIIQSAYDWEQKLLTIRDQ